jgi:hypothetical protein
VSRIAVNGRGYRAVLLGSPPRDWRSETRMPLIQLGVADRLQRDYRDVTVGFQALDGQRLSTLTFDDDRLNRAREAAELLRAGLRRHFLGGDHKRRWLTGPRRSTRWPLRSNLSI